MSILTEVLKQNSGKPALWLVTISHADISDIRIVNNNENITSNGDEYEKASFSITTPPQADGVPTVNFTIDNTDRKLMDLIQNIPDEPDINIKLILADDPDEIELEYDLKLSSVQGNVNTISGTLTYENILSFYYPFKTQNPNDFPGIF